MRTFSNGDTLNNLRVLNVLSNKYIVCMCNKCGITDIYSATELSDPGFVCRNCLSLAEQKFNKKLAVGDIKKHKILYDRDSKGVSRAGSDAYRTVNEFNGIKVGSIRNGMKLLYFISKTFRSSSDTIQYGNVYKAMFQCPGCGYLEEVKYDGEFDACECPNCKQLRNEARHRIAEATERLSKHSRVIANKNIDKIKMVPMSRVKSYMDSVVAGDKVDKHIKNIIKLNPNYEVLDINVVGGAITTVCLCKLCGSEITIPNGLRKKPMTCMGCKKAETNLNYKGVYKRNWVGLVRNNLEITDQNIKENTCDVKCRMCGHIQNNVSLYEVLNNKLFCECVTGDFDGVYYCDKCGKPMTIKLKNILDRKDTSKEIVCNNCKQDSGVKIQELLNDQIASDAKATTCNKLDVATKEYKELTVNVNDLIKCKKPLYMGVDGQLYYNCTCMIHNTSLILNDNEISNFDHSEYCDDGRQHNVKTLNSSEIKL